MKNKLLIILSMLFLSNTENISALGKKGKGAAGTPAAGPAQQRAALQAAEQKRREAARQAEEARQREAERQAEEEKQREAAQQAIDEAEAARKIAEAARKKEERRQKRLSRRKSTTVPDLTKDVKQYEAEIEALEQDKLNLNRELETAKKEIKKLRRTSKTPLAIESAQRAGEDDDAYIERLLQTIYDLRKQLKQWTLDNKSNAYANPVEKAVTKAVRTKDL